MLSRLDLRDFDGPVTDRLPRPRLPEDGPVDAVREILEEVRRGGDAALRELTRRYDRAELDRLTLTPDDLDAARARVPAEVLNALDAANSNIVRYHEQQRLDTVEHRSDGLRVRALHRAVAAAGCYVPGGRASYPSTVLMTASPARVAGVERVVVTVPPGANGRVPDVTLAAASIAGVDALHPVGGAQAIAALAYGTESIDPVDVIVGPGNVYVALAKQLVAGTVGVPSAFTGPSEVVVLADGSVPAEFAAIDLMVQAEHGPDGLAWLITCDDGVADAVDRELLRLVAAAPRRGDIESTLDAAGHAVVCRDLEQALDVANAIAPEHLELQTSDPESLLDQVTNAGAVFCGAWAPASIGDYVAGPSHVLPTNGTARFASALTVSDFVKDIHVVDVEPDGFAVLADHVETLASAEGLDAHAESIRIRRPQEK